MIRRWHLWKSVRLVSQGLGTSAAETGIWLCKVPVTASLAMET